MNTILSFMANQPLVFVFTLIFLGTLLGRVQIRGIGLGPAAVLFAAIGFAALAEAQGSPVVVPPLIGTLGLMLFTFAIGITSGAVFFANLRTGWQLILASCGLLAAVAATGFLLGHALGLDNPVIAGAFAGSMNNTPALGAAVEASGSTAPTIGYSVAYLFGAIAPLLMIIRSLSHRAQDADAPKPMVVRPIRVEQTDGFQTLGDVIEAYDGQVTFSRARRHTETAPVEIATADDPLEVNDVLVIDGPVDLVDAVTDRLGHISTHHIEAEPSLQMRRITLSNQDLAGLDIADLRLAGRFDAACTRLRRGDVDRIVTPDTQLQMGDRLRVVCPAQNMAEVTAFLGDSARGNSELNPLALAAGLVLGVLIGIYVIPGIHITIGIAAGCLLVGLLFGRFGRIGPVVTSMPPAAAQALTELGLLLFLAQAGTTAGGQIADAFSGGSWLPILITGAFFTTALIGGGYLMIRRFFGQGGTRTAGILAGMQTQPAHLAFAGQMTGGDERVNAGYALVYPAMMLAKILAANIMGALGM